MDDDDQTRFWNQSCEEFVPNRNTVDSIVGGTGTIVAPLVGLELQWDLRESLQDYGPDRTIWTLTLHAIVEAAGPEHSRFSTTPLAAFDAETLDERREAHRIAGEAADRLHVRLDAPSVDDCGGQAGSAWIRSIGVGVEVSYPIQWEAKWWTDEGEPRSDNGTQLVPATSGDEACMRCDREIENRLRQRPLEYRCYMPGRSAHASWYYIHGSQISREEVRELGFRESGSPSRIAQALVAKAANVTALSLMAAFRDSFRIRMEQLGPLARWRSGEVSDDDLDAALAGRIEDARSQWDGPRVLRTVRQEGRSVARCIRDKLQHGERWIEIAVQLLEAFGIGPSDAKDIIDQCDTSPRWYSGPVPTHDDIEIDRRIEEHIRKRSRMLPSTIRETPE